MPEDKLCGAPLRSLEQFQSMSLPGTTNALHTGILPSTKMVQQCSAIFSPTICSFPQQDCSSRSICSSSETICSIVFHDAMLLCAIAPIMVLYGPIGR